MKTHQLVQQTSPKGVV